MATTIESSDISDEASCLDLALEGQRLCRTGDILLGIKFFENALTLGTDDLKILTVVYSQLGNAYFSLRNYVKSLHYHRLDLDLSRRLNDLSGESKACGNLGNTLKMLGKFDEAIVCCEHHLKICQKLEDKSGIARALYNLANVYHQKAKSSGAIGRQDLGQFPPKIQEALEKAAAYYQENLELCREIGDRATEGLVCGNLANTHYLLGNFQKAVDLHSDRLTIAKEFGHRAAERRAYSNRGNAYIFLANFESAIEDYRCALQLAKELDDETLEAQVCYSLGNTYYILRRYSDAAACLDHHLRIARKLNDTIGEARACWSLTNIYSDSGDYQNSKKFATLHLKIASELGDNMEINTAKENLNKLDVLIQLHESKSTKVSVVSEGSTDTTDVLPVPVGGLNRNVGGSLRVPAVTKSTEKGSSITKSNSSDNLNKATASSSKGQAGSSGSTKVDNNSSHDDDEEEDFFSLLSKYQSRRMDEQRCSFRIEDMDEANSDGMKISYLSPAQNEFLDFLAGVQGSRMNDQRASMPDFPGLRASPQVISQLMANGGDGDTEDASDAFLDMVMRCQATRIEDQRSSLPDPSITAANRRAVVNRQSCPTVPDEDLFSLILRLQSCRLDEQRCSPPFQLPTFSLATTIIDDSDGVPEPQNRQSGSNPPGTSGEESYSCRGSRRRR